MPDRHRDPTVTARPPQEVKDAAGETLEARGWTVAEAVIAALSWILSDPDRAIKQLAPHRPPPKKTGRPRKNPDQSPT
jgi:hypothetical protein